MAKTHKYDDDRLLDAVMRYADIYKDGKIIITRLAEWSRENVPGLEEVTDKDFSRLQKDMKTGKSVHRPVYCRIQEINQERLTRKQTERNLLFTLQSIDDFFDLTAEQQRKYLLDARKQMKEKDDSIIAYSRQNKIYRDTNEVLRKKAEYIESIEDEVKDLEKDINDIEIILKKFIKATDESQRKEAIKKLGIDDDEISLERNIKNREEALDDVFNIIQTIKQNDISGIEGKWEEIKKKRNRAGEQNKSEKENKVPNLKDLIDNEIKDGDEDE